MEALELVRLNLLSPMVLAFALGAIATLVRSDLRFPDELYAALAIYLLLAIGLKGGAALAETPVGLVWRAALVTILVGGLTPFPAYAVLRRLGGFDPTNAAAVAAHYASVSVVTFTASMVFLQALGVPHEGFMPTLVALMEVPGIVVALLIARAQGSQVVERPGEVVGEILAGRSVLLLLGGLAIGYLVGQRGFAQVAPFFADPFQGALTLFLLEMGMVTARRLRDLRQVGLFLAAFGVVMPILQGAAGVYLGGLAGLSPGGSMIFGTMTASASYIAAPAAVRMALPEANPGYYLTAALGITFPFNLVLGIPLYHALATALHGGG